MHIIVINRFSSPFYSGAGVAAERICAFLDINGYFVTHLSFKNAFWPSRFKKSERYRRVYFPLFSHVESTERYFSRFYSFLFEFYILFFLLRSIFCCDVIYYASLTRLNFISIIFCKLFNKKVVAKISGNDDDMLSLLIIRVGKFSNSFVYQKVDRYVALNRIIFEDLCKFVPSVKVVQTNNLTDLNRDSLEREFSKRYRRDPDIIHFVFSGVISKRKGTDSLLKCWKEWVQGKNAVLNLVGPVEKNFQFIIDPTDSSIKYHGLQNLDYVYDLYSKSDVFILPTSSEGMPNSLLEALLFSMPCIVTNIDGITDHLASGNVIYPLNSNLSNLCESLNDLYFKKGLRYKLTNAAYNWSKINMDNCLIIDKYFSKL